jgi:ADP-heptose:LPS heptosyltransferase
MRILRLSTRSKFTEHTFRTKNPVEVILEADKDYVCTDHFAAEIRKRHPLLRDDVFLGKEYDGRDLNGKSLLVFRTGGIGDVLFVTPSLAELKKLYPNCKIGFATEEVYHELLKENVDEHFPSLLDLDKISSYDYVAVLENSIEGNPEAETIDPYVITAKKLFVLPSSFNPIVSLDKEEEQRISRIVDKRKFNIVLQYSASVKKRSVNPELWFRFLLSLRGENIVVWISDIPHMDPEVSRFVELISEANKGVKFVNFAGKTTRVSSIGALIKNSDLVIGLDSSYVHFAGAFGIPMIGLYGAFPSKLRLNHYKNAIGIDANSKCVFAKNLVGVNCCYEHGSGNCRLGDLLGRNNAPCMDLILPTHLNSAFLTLLERVYNGSTKKS